MKVLCESMTKFSVRVGLLRWDVRIWREETGDGSVDHAALMEQAASLRTPGDMGVDFAKKVLELDRVNAVEVIDATGNGGVLYRDWP